MTGLRRKIFELLKRVYLRFYTTPVVSRFVVNQFHRLFYYTPYSIRTWQTTSWLGVPLFKCPFDLWMYQEMVNELKPDLIIECGTGNGGSALFMASICDLIGHGRVISIDVEQRRGWPEHKRITYLRGSSTADHIHAELRAGIAETDQVMVVLDSDHSMHHVLDELRLFSKYIKPGGYLIVEDTNINGHPVSPQFGPGPFEAVHVFVRENRRFVIDKRREKFLLSFNPDGYLKKIQ